MPYEDRVTEEAWAISSSKEEYEKNGSKWEPWKLNLVSVNIADLISGKKGGLKITLPDEEDYVWAKEKVDSIIEESKYRLARLKRARIIYSVLPPDDVDIHPSFVELNASWNGMRDPLPVDEFFFLAGIPEEELKLVFHCDPENIPPSIRYQEDGFFGFAKGGRQRLVELVGKPIAFVYPRARDEGGS